MKNIFCFLILLISSFSANAQTYLSGTIGDSILTPQGNPYFLAGDLTVPPNKTVTIEAGCILLFNPFTGLIINGSLVVKGTEENEVVFASINDTTYNSESALAANPFDWNGILIGPDAEKIALSCFILRHSVYGIKSSISTISIRKGTFAHNGQFNFAINDKLMPVVDNIPYSYSKNNAVTEKAAPAHSDTKMVKKKKNPFWLFAGIAIGAVTIALPVVYYFHLSGEPSGADSTVITIN